jgi:hypothetical protein
LYRAQHWLLTQYMIACRYWGFGIKTFIGEISNYYSYSAYCMSHAIFSKCFFLEQDCLWSRLVMMYKIANENEAITKEDRLSHPRDNHDTCIARLSLCLIRLNKDKNHFFPWYNICLEPVTTAHCYKSLNWNFKAVVSYLKY